MKVDSDIEPIDPSQYPYPPSTPGADPASGVYWHGLNDTSHSALTSMEEWVTREQIDLSRLSTTDLHPSLLLLRYLRANQFDTKKAQDQIMANMQWRADSNVSAIIQQRPEDILGMEMEELIHVFPHWHSGYDKTGRPVLYKQYAKFEATMLKARCGGSFDAVLKYHIWEQEACARLCAARSHQTQTTVETVAVVIDVKDMRMRQVNGDFVNLVKQIAEVDGKQYPETMGRTFIVNAPSYFSLAWRLVRGFIDPVTVAKISILGGPKDYEPVLREFIGIENLPSNYGGTLPALSTEVHPYEETMKSYPEVEQEECIDNLADEAEAALDVIKYPYPPSTPGADPASGVYWHGLNDMSRSALTSMEEWVTREQIDLSRLSTTDLHPSLLLLRYLRANQFDTKKAQDQIMANMQWRADSNVSAIIQQRPEDILGMEMEELIHVFPHWHSGYDKTGRPVLYKQYAKFEATMLKARCGGSFDAVLKYHIWEQEACARLCAARSHQTQTTVETVAVVIDVKDMRMRQVNGDFVNLVKQIAEVDGKQYPETMGRTFIVNAPSYFSLAWRLVRGFIDPVTVAKISILGGPKDYEPVLQEFIGIENLPSNYGGTLPALSTEVHPYEETMKSYPEVEKAVLSTMASDKKALDVYERINSEKRGGKKVKRRSMRGLESGAAAATAAAAAATITADSAGSNGGIWGYAVTLLGGIQTLYYQSPPIDDTASSWAGGSDRDSDSDSDGSSSEDDSNDPSYADAFETQSDLESNTHSYAYSLSEAGRLASNRHAHHHRRHSGSEKKQCLFRYFNACFRRSMFERTLSKWKVEDLVIWLLIALALHGVCAGTAAGISATALTEITWSGTGARLQLWTYTVVMLVACLMIIFDGVGAYGVMVKNWVLLSVYTASISVGTIIFTVVTIAAFIYYYLPKITLAASSALDSAGIPNASERNQRFLLILAIGCLIASFFGALPVIFSRAMVRNLRKHNGKKAQTSQIQVTLKIAQIISVCQAIVMLSYGGLCISYLLQIRYTAALFPLYGLIYGGVSVLISSTIGVWAANTVHRSVLRLYQYFILPFLIVVLLVVSLISFERMYTTEKTVAETYDDLKTTESEESVQADVTTFLLVTAVLSLFTCLFQTISLIATQALAQTIDSCDQVKEKMKILQAMREKELGIYTPEGGGGGRGQKTTALANTNSKDKNNKDYYWADFTVEDLSRLYLLYARDKKDRALITWGVCMGLFNIFVNGTLAIFSRYASMPRFEGNWVFALLDLLGKADSRFADSDVFIRSSEALLAIAIGPMCLLYAWSTFVFAPYRHVLGILTASAHITDYVMYILVELYAGMRHMQGLQEPTLLAFLIVVGVVGYVLVPSWVLYKEITSSINDTTASDTNDLLLDAEQPDETNFLSAYRLKQLEEGFAQATAASAAANGYEYNSLPVAGRHSPYATYSEAGGKFSPGKQSSPHTPIMHVPTTSSETSADRMLLLGGGGGGGGGVGGDSRQKNDHHYYHSSHSASQSASSHGDTSASTRSFLLQLGSESNDSTADLRAYRTRAASAFASQSSYDSLQRPSLYADKPGPAIPTPTKGSRNVKDAHSRHDDGSDGSDSSGDASDLLLAHEDGTPNTTTYPTTTAGTTTSTSRETDPSPNRLDLEEIHLRVTQDAGDDEEVEEKVDDGDEDALVHLPPPLPPAASDNVQVREPSPFRLQNPADVPGHNSLVPYSTAGRGGPHQQQQQQKKLSLYSGISISTLYRPLMKPELATGSGDGMGQIAQGGGGGGESTVPHQRSGSLGSYLRRRSVAPLRARTATAAAGDSMGNPGNAATTSSGSVAGSAPSLTRQSSAEQAMRYAAQQVATVAAAAAGGGGGGGGGVGSTSVLDPHKVLPMLMRLGVSSAEAAGMMTYLMRMQQLRGTKKGKKSIAMVV